MPQIFSINMPIDTKCSVHVYVHVAKDKYTCKCTYIDTQHNQHDELSCGLSIVYKCTWVERSVQSIECRGFESPPEAVFSLPWVCCVALPCLFV